MLSIVPSVAQEDTLFRAIGEALGLNPQLIRHECLMRFIHLTFVTTSTTVAAFLQEVEYEVDLHPSCFHDDAIQMWVYRMAIVRSLHTKGIKFSRDLFLLDPELFKKEAIKFIMENNQIGKVTCKWTMFYLVSAIYRCTIILFETLEDGSIVQQVPIEHEDKLKGYILPSSNSSSGEEEDSTIATHGRIYLYKTAQNRYYLLMPSMSMAKRVGSGADAEYTLQCGKRVASVFKATTAHLWVAQVKQLGAPVLYHINTRELLHVNLYAIHNAAHMPTPQVVCISKSPNPYFFLAPTTTHLYMDTSGVDSEETLATICKMLGV